MHKQNDCHSHNAKVFSYSSEKVRKFKILE